MKRLISLSIIVLVGSVWAFAQPAGEGSKYVGYKYKGVIAETVLPNGVKHLGGGLASDINKDPVYGISEVARGRTRMLWLEVSTGQDDKGVTGWEVKDVLSFPNWSRTQHMFYSLDPTIECQRNGRGIENLVAVGRIVRRQDAYLPSKAWVVDIKAEKFKPIPLKGLKCVYSEP